jgi:hypothetical protein
MTNPSPQPLPYLQDFSSLTPDSAAYPAGWQGWSLSPDNDCMLVGNGTAKANAGNIWNYDGKIGYLSTGALRLALVLALDTTDRKGVSVAYDVMTIRNPYNGSMNTRINEVTLQYRVGTVGQFTDLAGSQYQNNAIQQTGAVTDPQNVVAKSIPLPSDCDNQAVVQLRWTSHDVSGAGYRPSFAVDNLSIEGTAAHTITVLVNGNGSIAPSDERGVILVPDSDEQTFTITPDAGHHVDDLIIDGASVGAMATYTFSDVKENHTIEALFAVDTYTIMSTARANGSITPSGAIVVDGGANSSFVIAPDAGYHVDDLLIDGASVGAMATYTFSDVTENHTIEAVFALDE